MTKNVRLGRTLINKDIHVQVELGPGVRICSNHRYTSVTGAELSFSVHLPPPATVLTR